MSRPADVILGELRTLHALQADAQVQLTSVRVDKEKLEAHEDSLLLAIAGRGGKIDKLLDEYGQAMHERGKALT